MTASFAALFAAACALALFDWKRGLLACLAIGFLQDPARKVAAGQPVYYVVAVAVVFSLCLLGALVRRQQISLRSVTRWFPSAAPPAALFVTVVVLGALVTVLRWGRPIVAGIGLLAYLSPPAAMILGQAYSQGRDDLRRWLRAYVLMAMAAAATVLAQFIGLQSTFFKSLGTEVVFGTGGAVYMMCGVMRTSEIAAWHAAAAACIAVALAVTARSTRGRLLGGALFFALTLVVVLTGRRKMLAAILLFVLIYFFLLARYGRGASRLIQSLVGVGALLVLGTQWLGLSAEEIGAGSYLGRSASVVREGTDRLLGMTVGQFGNIISRNGLWGAGVGTGAQGAQYFGGGADVVGGAAEGGLGRVLAELGVPGLLVVFWLGMELTRALARAARLARHLPTDVALLTLGVIAFLPANAAVFLTAHQVFGDPFVLIVLGFLAGQALAVPKLVARHLAASRASVGPFGGPAPSGAEGRQRP